jgi:hypothetical protein
VRRAGVDDSTLWSIDAPAGRRTGRFATADFVGDSLADWDSRPQAVRAPMAPGLRLHVAVPSLDPCA